ncbi:MAG: 50S ribosomal protein L24 [Thermoplasmata archaeon]|nr:50S ribosomal protein L24 [Thermoplasmata archaeon]
MARNVSIKARKKRQALANAPLHRMRKNLGTHLSPKYLEDEKVDYPRSAVVKKGDLVKIMRGSEKGKEGKVTDIDMKTGKVAIEGITIAKADGSQVERYTHASNIMITKILLDDSWRKKKLEGGK